MSSPTSFCSSTSSTRHSSTRARHVFGDLILDVAESPVGSLSYSPSPSLARVSPVNTASKDSADVSENHPKVIDFNNKENVPTKRRINEKKVSFAEQSDNTFDSKDELYRFRTQSQRWDLVKKTQDAINTASISVNQTLNAARHAKINLNQKRATATAKLRDQWKEEKEEAHLFHAETAKQRQELLALQKQLSTKFRTNKNARDLLEKQKQLDAIVRESEFKSEVFRQHQSKLKEERYLRRRESTEKRAALRRVHRDGEEKLRMIQIEEDEAVHEERYATSIATREYKKRCADHRRTSFQFRTGDARRIRELHAKIESDRKVQSQANYELQFAADRDTDTYRKKQEEERRYSLAFRNEEGRKHREKELLLRSENLVAQHASYELKLAGERDSDKYKKFMADEKRKSLAFRNQEGHLHKELRNQQVQEEMVNMHQNYELKWAGEKDVEAYEQKMEENRRNSLAWRNLKGKRERDKERERQLEAQADAHSSFELKCASLRDVDAHHKKMAEQRRDSVAARNKESRKQRNETISRENNQTELVHQEYELKWKSENDVAAYNRHMEKERRESLRVRNEERVSHAKVMDELRSLAIEQQTESLMLKWAGENDAKNYLGAVEDERRKSLKFRNKEGKRLRDLDKAAYNAAVSQAHEEEVLQAAAHNDVENYKKECAKRDRLSIQFRLKEANIQRLEEVAEREKHQEIEEFNKLLEEHAWSDVQEYFNDCQQRKRQSLAFRAKEKRKHFQWAQLEAEREIERQSKDSRYRSLDRRHQEMAKSKERARIVLDAIQHAGCTFSSNPVGHLV